MSCQEIALLNAHTLGVLILTAVRCLPSIMDDFATFRSDYSKGMGTQKSERDVVNQIILSVALGLSAFLGFCVGHPDQSIASGLTISDRSCDLNGQVYTPHARSNGTKQASCPSYQNRYLAGSSPYGALPTSRSSRLRVWMLMWYVTRYLVFESC